MPHPDEDPPKDRPAADPPEEAPAPGARRRADLDRIFGDVLPDITRDEQPDREAGGDDWYVRNRPPHHGG